MIRKSYEILNGLENPRNTGPIFTTDVEQFPEGSQSAEDTGFVPPQASIPEFSVPQTQSDPNSVNVYVNKSISYMHIMFYVYGICFRTYEIDDTFPNTVVTIDATHHMRMPPALLRHMQNHLQSSNSHQTSAEQSSMCYLTTNPVF